MFRETAGVADLTIDERLEALEDNELTDRLLSAVETYKQSCRAAGEEPTEEDAWLVLLSALQLAERDQGTDTLAA